MNRNFHRTFRVANTPLNINQKSRYLFITRIIFIGVTNRKLLSEAEFLSKHPIPGCEASPREDDLMIWTAVIEGPLGSFYENGHFFVQLRFNDNYPFTPPVVRLFYIDINLINLDYLSHTNISL
jgi:ubiquitin-protein ligase